MSDPLYALQPVAEIGSQYAERCLSYFASLPLEQDALASSAGDVRLG